MLAHILSKIHRRVAAFGLPSSKQFEIRSQQSVSLLRAAGVHKIRRFAVPGLFRVQWMSSATTFVVPHFTDATALSIRSIRLGPSGILVQYDRSGPPSEIVVTELLRDVSCAPSRGLSTRRAASQ